MKPSSLVAAVLFVICVTDRVHSLGNKLLSVLKTKQ